MGWGGVTCPSAAPFCPQQLGEGLPQLSFSFKSKTEGTVGSGDSRPISS